MSRVAVIVVGLVLISLAAASPLAFPNHPGDLAATAAVHSLAKSAHSRSRTRRTESSALPDSNQAIATPGGATAAVFDPLNQRVYVADVVSDQITVINTTTDTVNTTISITGQTLTGQGSANYIIDPSSLAFDPDNLDLYLADSGGTNVSVVNTTNDSVIATIPLNSSPNALTVDAANNLVYVAAGGGLAVINGTTNTVENYNTAVCGGSDVAIDLNVIFVSCWSFPYIEVIAFGPFGDVVGTIPISSGNAASMAYDPSTGDIYAISNGIDANITVINATTFATVKVISVNSGFYAWDNGLVVVQGAYPQILAVAGGGVSSGFYLEALNPITLQLLPPANLNTEAYGVAVNPETGVAYVTDAFNDTEIVRTPGATPPGVQITPAHLVVDANESEVFTTTVSGASPITYSYVPSSSAVVCGVVTGAAVGCLSSQVGLNYTVTVHVSDFYGIDSSATSAKVEVTSALTAGLAASNTTPLLGQTIALVTSASGGAAPYSFNYTGLPSGCTSQDTASIGCLPTQADFYNATVIVTDQNGGTATASVEIHVIFDFNVIVPTNTSAGSPFTISVNTNETFAGDLTGVPGSGSVAFSYNYSGLPPGCTSENVAVLTCTPRTVGTYHITVSVRDPSGAEKSHTVTVNVVTSSSGSGLTKFLTSPLGYATVGVLLAAAVIAATLLYRRRGPRSNPTKSTATTPEEDPVKSKPDS